MSGGYETKREKGNLMWFSFPTGSTRRISIFRTSSSKRIRPRERHTSTGIEEHSGQAADGREEGGAAVLIVL